MTIHLSQAEVNLIIAGIVLCFVGVGVMLIANWLMTRKWHKPRKEKK